MKLKDTLDTTNLTSVGEGLTSVKASINGDNMLSIFKLMIEKYNDPATAVVREYTSNAWDAHEAFKNENGHYPDNPVEVTIPLMHSVEQTMIFKDYGIGMSGTEMAEVYTQFGKSTKTGNDYEQGGLGVGCKSGFAISPSMVISSVKDGLLNVMVATMDSQDITYTFLVENQETDQHSGTTVVIDMSNAEEVHLFSLYRSYHIFSGWSKNEVLVKIQPLKESSKLPNTTFKYNALLNDNRIPDKAVLTPCGSAYTFDVQKVIDNGTSMELEGGALLGKVFYANENRGWTRGSYVIPVFRLNGEVKPNQSRESIVEDKDFNRLSKERTEIGEDYMLAVVQSNIDSAKDFSAACHIFSETRRVLNSKTFTYNGEDHKLPDYLVLSNKGSSHFSFDGNKGDRIFDANDSSLPDFGFSLSPSTNSSGITVSLNSGSRKINVNRIFQNGNRARGGAYPVSIVNTGKPVEEVHRAISAILSANARGDKLLNKKAAKMAEALSYKALKKELENLSPRRIPLPYEFDKKFGLVKGTEMSVEDKDIIKWAKPFVKNMSKKKAGSSSVANKPKKKAPTKPVKLETVKGTYLKINKDEYNFSFGEKLVDIVNLLNCDDNSFGGSSIYFGEPGSYSKVLDQKYGPGSYDVTVYGTKLSSVMNYAQIKSLTSDEDIHIFIPLGSFSRVDDYMEALGARSTKDLVSKTAVTEAISGILDKYPKTMWSYLLVNGLLNGSTHGVSSRGVENTVDGERYYGSEIFNWILGKKVKGIPEEYPESISERKLATGSYLNLSRAVFNTTPRYRTILNSVNGTTNWVKSLELIREDLIGADYMETLDDMVKIIDILEIMPNEDFVSVAYFLRDKVSQDTSIIDSSLVMEVVSELAAISSRWSHENGIIMNRMYRTHRDHMGKLGKIK